MTHSHLSFPHAVLALAVMAVWGTNFVIMRIGLDHLPPLLFATLRFAMVVFPVILFLPRPAAPWRRLVGYGLAIGVGQFGLLFVALNQGLSPGLASLVMQAQVFFTIGLSMLSTSERLRGFQWAALLLSVAGILIIGVNGGGEATPIGLSLALVAAFGWAIGNTIQRQDAGANMLAYVVWSSLFAVPPLALLSLTFEGWPAISAGLQAADAATWSAVAWQALGNSLFGYSAWGWLLGRYPAASVAPMSLLVPIFGIAASVWWLGEPLQGWKIAAGLLVLAGLALNLLWPRLAARLAAPGA
jgi:O-acetylserine/cysteine efflux transporter